jgi:5-methylcytosine-specific restriction endonuclease McrBC GTP-binding regulatory subunit McrB
MTKTEMAQVIVQALRNYDEPARADSARVKEMARRSKANLSQFYPKAVKILEERKGAQ